MIGMITNQYCSLGNDSEYLPYCLEDLKLLFLSTIAMLWSNSKHSQPAFLFTQFEKSIAYNPPGMTPVYFLISLIN